MSDFIEPVVEKFEGGLEIISTEDMLALIDELNIKMKDWTPTSWWEGVTEGEFVACGDCAGNEDHEYSDKTPELCKCNSDTDVTLACNDDEPVRAHKVVLGARSPIFRNDLVEGETALFDATDVTLATDDDAHELVLGS